MLNGTVNATLTALIFYASHIVTRYAFINEHLRVIFHLAQLDGSMTSEHSKLLTEKSKRIKEHEVITNCARLHQKLADIVTVIDDIYSLLVSNL